MRFLSSGLALWLVVCNPSTAERPDASRTDAPRRPDGGLPPAPTPDGTFPAHEHALPFDYERTDVGTALTAAELTTATDHYLALLDRTDWLDQIEARAHGWPESDAAGHPWYATWWSGVGIHVEGTERSFVHVDRGADNNGLRTPQLLEGACYAWRLWSNDQDQHLVRRLVRGLSSWHLAMRRNGSDAERGLLARAAYPPSILDETRGVFLDYDADRPGVGVEPSFYVHLPENPSWGDVYVKNQRSKDDMGHLMRAVAAMDACEGSFTEAGADDDLREMRRLYMEWAQRVEREGFRIATLEEGTADVVFPSGDLATYTITGGIECHAEIAIRLLSRGEPLGAECATPTGPVPDPVGGLNNSALQILRTHHEAAAALALVTGQEALAEELLAGLAARLEMILDRYEAGEMPDNARPGDVFQLMVESANLGVPLTSREVRWLHARIEEAYAGYDTSGPEWHVFEPGASDGDYTFEPGGPGIDFKDLGLLLGTCVAPYVNPAGRAVLDCDRVRAHPR